MDERRNTLGEMISGLLLSPFRSGNVVTFHTGRSGSTVLGDLLNQHPNIFWDAEIYNPARMERISPKIPHFLLHHPKRFLRLRMARAGNKIYGFEMQLTQLKYIDAKLLDYIEQLQGMKFNHFIILKRKNYLRKILSSVVGQITSQWHQNKNAKPKLIRFELDVDNLLFRGNAKPLLVHLQAEHEHYCTLEKVLSGQRVLQLTYEDDISESPLVGYQRVCNFLDVGHHEVKIRYGKTNPFKLTEMIINFDEVERTLRGTSFEWMLYE